MAVENAKKQDYLAVGNYAAQIRQDATFHIDILSTTTEAKYRHLTTAVTRLTGIRIVTDTVLVAGDVAVTVSRVRAGVLVTLANFLLDGSLVTAVNTVFELTAAQMNLVTNKGVVAGDAILVATVVSTVPAPTAANFSLALQFAQNGPR